MLNVYLEEANELLQKLESCLLALNENANNKNHTEEIFRIMHTLKGNSSMFGLENVAAFIHNLESLHDNVRTERQVLTKEIIEGTFHSLDHIKNIINDPDLEKEENQTNNKRLTESIISLMSNEDSVNHNIKKDLSSNDLIEKTENTYYILFKPSITFLDNGSNPLLIINELASIGKIKVIPRFKKNESLLHLNVINCFAYWEIIISTQSFLEEIKDVFIFIDSTSELRIELLATKNLIVNFTFSEFINSFPMYVDEIIGFKKIKEFIDNNDILLIDKISMSNLEKNDNPSFETFSDSTFTKPEKENRKVISKKEKTISSIRVSSDKLDDLMSIVSELVTTQASLTLHTENTRHPELEVITENVEKLSRRLRDVAFGMTLIPIKNIMSRFQRLVKDVSKELNKDIDIDIIGDETELDKNIIESLTDPIMHILRNSLDHGIELAEERIRKGKNPKGKIIFKAYYSGANVHIEISDDGKGLNPEFIRNSAIKKGLISEDVILSEKETLELIFAPGFSTAAKITDVSGRGVGMDVVRRNIDSLRGEIDIKSNIDIGTTFIIILPLTLSIIDGLLVRIDDVRYIIPLAVVDKCYELKFDLLQNNFNKLVVLDGVQIPFLNLREKFKVDSSYPDVTQLIVVNNGDRKVGITIDEIVGEYQAVLKPLGKYYKNQDFISGATILGDGTVALVFDTNKIISQFAISTLETINH